MTNGYLLPVVNLRVSSKFYKNSTMGIEFEVIYVFKFLKLCRKRLVGVLCNLSRMLLHLHTVLLKCARAYIGCRENASALRAPLILDLSGPTA